MILCEMVFAAPMKSSAPSLPWLYRQIPLATSEDIETRLYRNQASDNEDILIRKLQII